MLYIRGRHGIDTRKMFEYDCKRCKTNWCNDMKQLFNIIGKMSIFEEKTSCNILKQIPSKSMGKTE